MRASSHSAHAPSPSDILSPARVRRVVADDRDANMINSTVPAQVATALTFLSFMFQSLLLFLNKSLSQ